MRRYDRELAVAYAARWWDRFNPAYPALADDCTSFISQVLHAGGMPQEPAARRDRGWWYRHRREGWSLSWAVAHALRWYLEQSGRGERVPEADLLRPGDVVFYDWQGDGRIDHSAVVVEAGAAAGPLVAAHTRPAFGRPWAYTDSPAFTPATRYLFMRMREALLNPTGPGDPGNVAKNPP